MPPAETVGSRIRWLRGTLSQDEFATRIGVHKNALGKYERDENIPGGDVLTRFYEVLDVNITWLLTNVGHPHVKTVPDEPRGPNGTSAESSPVIDPQLLSRVYDKVLKAFTETGLSITPLALGKLVAEIYNEVAGQDDDPEERLIALGSRIDRLIRELRATPAP